MSNFSYSFDQNMSIDDYELVRNIIEYAYDNGSGLSLSEISFWTQISCIEVICYHLNLFNIKNDSALEEAMIQLAEQNPKALSDYTSGKKTALGALVGFVKKNNPTLDPSLIKEAIVNKYQ